jgi:hypothetical protein
MKRQENGHDYGSKTDKSDVTGDVPLSDGNSEPNHQGKRNTCWNREIGYSCLTCHQSLL